MDLWLVLVRFVHYGASLVLFGLVLFPIYACPPGTGREAAGRTLAISLWLSLLVLVSGILWFIAVATSMTETEVSWETARFVLTETSFGAVSQLRLVAIAAAAGILALLARGSTTKLAPFLIVICVVLLGSLAGVGHAQVEDGQSGALHIFSDTLHLLAAGAWLGGLVGLLDLTVAAIRGKRGAESQARDAAFRFSNMGYAAVTILLLSGLANSWFLVGSLTNLVTTTYGQLLLLKVALFAAMFCLAGINRFFVAPALLRSAASGGLRTLLFTVTAEQSLGLAIVLVISLLGVTEPAAGS